MQNKYKLIALLINRLFKNQKRQANLKIWVTPQR